LLDGRSVVSGRALVALGLLLALVGGCSGVVGRYRGTNTLLVVSGADPADVTNVARRAGNVFEAKAFARDLERASRVERGHLTLHACVPRESILLKVMVDGASRTEVQAAFAKLTRALNDALAVEGSPGPTVQSLYERPIITKDPVAGPPHC
jgi:hypothetical protein